MVHLQRSLVTLWIKGDDLVPQEISHLLACRPTSSQFKSEEIIGKKSGRARIAQFAMWRLEASPCEPEDIGGQISEIHSQLSDDLEVWKAIP